MDGGVFLEIVPWMDLDGSAIDQHGLKLDAQSTCSASNVHSTYRAE